MALRLDTAIIRGELDNTTRGNLRGKLWLVGHADPLVLDLRGDAWRDVAGCKVSFTNPKPEAQANTATLQAKQQGFVGDITASRKVKVPTVPEEEWIEACQEGREIPSEWRNSLYVEWFSKTDGRIVIESTSFEVSVSEWMWEMDTADEEAQKMANLQSMRTWLAGVIQRPDEDEETECPEDFDDSEEAWEDSLKQSDRLNDAYAEALEKYGDESFDDDQVSFVMGWDHMLNRDGPGTDDDEDEGESWKEAAESMPDLSLEDLEEMEEELIDDESPERHPLHKRSYELVLRLLTELKDEKAEKGDANVDSDTAPLDRFIRNTMNISGKLAGALGTRRFRGSENRGYTLAILRRCLNWANEALAALNELDDGPEWQGRQHLLHEFRTELFALRDGMTDLRKELREDEQ